MRRRLEIFIPIVLFSVLVQLIAPISAFRVVANAVSDPLYMASIDGRLCLSGRRLVETRTRGARRYILR